MKVLLISYYYEPDFCAGSFRAKALSDAFIQHNQVSSLIIITTQPNRYGQNIKLPVLSKNRRRFVIRFRIPEHRNRFILQIISFSEFFIKTIKWSLKNSSSFDIIVSTSSRTGTSFLGYIISRLTKKKQFADIRDIFSDNLNSIFAKGLLKDILIKTIMGIEKRIINNAHWLNFVSPGFSNFYKLQLVNKKVKYFTNGIDSVFLKYRFQESQIKKVKNKKIVIYAGNIGFGQNLEKIVPAIAKNFQQQIEFYIIGDGSSKSKLISEIFKLKLNNVIIKEPVSREKLIQWYLFADILFLHLADIHAFKNVLPSKLFEYAAFNKPILAGVAGTAKKFLRENIPDTKIFAPENVNDATTKMEEILEKSSTTNLDREKFIKRYTREKIMRDMVDSIIYAYG